MTNLPVAPGMIFAFHFNESYLPYVYIDYNNFDGRALHKYVDEKLFGKCTNIAHCTRN